MRCWRVLFIVAAAAVLAGPLAAQRNSAISYSVKLHVYYSDNNQPVGQAMVRLQDRTHADIATAATESTGDALFTDLKPATYYVQVTGRDIEPTSSQFDIVSGIATSVAFVPVKRSSPPLTPVSKNGSLVSTADLNVPSEAHKEADKGFAALDHKDYKQARKHFEKATEIYPRYASAYHALGVTDMRSGDLHAARLAFERSISLDDRYTAAFLDLSRLYYAENKYAEAEALLDKAIIAEPANPEVLTMLARAELLDGKPDKAITTARKVHEMPGHEPYAIAHFIAGKAYESQGDRQQAVAEYQEFLKEAPNAPNADRVRATLQGLQKK